MITGGGGGGGGAITLLSTTTLAAPGTFDVSGISGAYNDLILVLIARGTNAAQSESPMCTFNADAGANYYRELIQFIGNGAVSGTETRNAAGLGMGTLPASTSPANVFGVTEITLYGYASTTWQKNTQWHSFALQLTTTTNIVVHRGGGLWASTAAINRVQISGGSTANLDVGSQLRIYGRT